MRRHKIVVQKIMRSCWTPSHAQLQRWINKALQNKYESVELTLRIVDEQESANLNQRYRNKTGPTNILSFMFDCEYKTDPLILGDLVICPPLLVHEAKEQEKSLEAHWAHLVIHGILHLLGHDHETEKSAKEMEMLEIQLLKELKYENPYE